MPELPGCLSSGVAKGGMGPSLPLVALLWGWHYGLCCVGYKGRPGQPTLLLRHSA